MKSQHKKALQVLTRQLTFYVLVLFAVTGLSTFTEAFTVINKQNSCL